MKGFHVRSNTESKNFSDVLPFSFSYVVSACELFAESYAMSSMDNTSDIRLG